VNGAVLMVSPSRGLGGGVERYAETLEWALAEENVACHRFDLRGAGLAAHARLLAKARAHLRASGAPSRILVVHRGLLPLASVIAKRDARCGISLVCHGAEIWAARRWARVQVENHLMRGPRVRVVAVSSFTAGVLFGDRCSATVLPPGLSRPWFDTLVGASGAHRPLRDGRIRVVTAFRLTDWRNKGLPQLLDAIADMGRPDVSVTICGSGRPPSELLHVLQSHPQCTLKIGLSDQELACELAAADLFVLATRTRHGRTPSGEGFGLALLEAQVAGTPVVAPAFAGSHDAFVDRVSGVAPADETAGSLARVLGELLKDPSRLEQMGRQAAAWSRKSFAPEIYASRAAAALL
jgi:phosphatidyl-myo-inositol dimannoside synthase